MKLNVQKTPLVAALVSAGLLSAGISGCGGGGDGAVASSGPAGAVIGSYYEGAVVCVDVNNNGVADAGETNCATTDASGKFTLGAGSSGALVATIGTSAKKHAVPGDAGTAVATAMTFRAPAGVTIVSAITTELAVLMDDGATLDDAKASLAAKYGVSTAQLTEDFNTENSGAVKTALQGASDGYIKNVLAATAPGAADLARIQNVIVIYAENHSFDNLYGRFPGANGTPSSPAKQLDRDGTVLATLPPIWGGLSGADVASAPAGTTVFAATVDTAGGAVASAITQAQTVGMPNAPYQIDGTSGFFNTGVQVRQNVVTVDMYHRFYNEQMQIGADGKKAGVTAWGDSGGMVMGYYDGSSMGLWTLARNYTLADNFYQAAFGGSFLNHQYLVCACAPEYPNATTDDNGTGTAVAPAVATIDTGDGKGRTGIQGVALSIKSTSPASALGGQAAFTADNYVTPQVSINTATGQATYGTGTWYGVNTMQPPYQPSSNPPPAADAALLTAERSTARKNTLPAQPSAKTTIGDALDAKSVTWAWYAGAWNAAQTAGRTAGHNMASVTSASVNFQFHHHPFNYYAKFDPAANAAYRAAHLKDKTDLDAAIAGGTLPAVTFYKPNGPLNQHPGYANVTEGDDHIVTLVNQIMNSAYKDKVLIVVTYDEFGGQWDHAPVPKGDWVGPGSRIPALIISPFARKGFVDHTQYDTASILRFLVKWKGLDATLLPGLKMRDDALVANGGKKMGDLTGALSF